LQDIEKFFIEYFISNCQNENIFNEIEHDIKYFNVTIIKVIEEILTNNKSTDIMYILHLIEKNILKLHDNQMKQQRQLEKKERNKEANFLNITKEHILKELYERHTLQYLLTSNIFKNKNEFESRLEEENSFNISKIIPTWELEVKKDESKVKVKLGKFAIITFSVDDSIRNSSEISKIEDEKDQSFIQKALDQSNLSKTFEKIVYDLDNKLITKESDFYREEFDKVLIPQDSKYKLNCFNSNNEKNEFNLRLLKKKEKERNNSAKKNFQLSLESKTDKLKKEKEKLFLKNIINEPKMENQFINESDRSHYNSIILNKKNKEKININSRSVILTPSKLFLLKSKKGQILVEKKKIDKEHDLVGEFNKTGLNFNIKFKNPFMKSQNINDTKQNLLNSPKK